MEQTLEHALKTSGIMKRTGVGRNTLRFYETKGLIKASKRTPAGYRLYSHETLLDLQFIKQAKAAGLALDEIKDLLTLGRDDGATCGAVATKIESQITHIDALMTQLQLRRAFLSEFVATCKANDTTKRCDIRLQGFRPSACCK